MMNLIIRECEELTSLAAKALLTEEEVKKRILEFLDDVEAVDYVLHAGKSVCEVIDGVGMDDLGVSLLLFRRVDDPFMDLFRELYLIKPVGSCPECGDIVERIETEDAEGNPMILRSCLNTHCDFNYQEHERRDSSYPRALS